jgi:positive regulator of sigma E activity
MSAPSPDPQPAPAVSSRVASLTRPARVVLDAYSGEHGIYGVVLVTALIAVAAEEDTDLDVLLFVVGTVFVFWLCHVYAAVVASRSPTHGRGESVGAAIRSGARHASGMLLAMLVPALLLGLGVAGLVDEWTAYLLALGSGVILLALIGYANAARNRSPWYWRILGVLATTGLGLIVILLSILTH